MQETKMGDARGRNEACFGTLMSLFLGVVFLLSPHGVSVAGIKGRTFKLGNYGSSC